MRIPGAAAPVVPLPPEMFVTALLVVASLAAHTQKPRTPIACTLSNGDHLSGDLLSITPDQLRMSHSVLGVIAVPRTDIAICETGDTTAVRELGAQSLRPLSGIPAAAVVALPEFVATPLILAPTNAALERLIHPAHPAQLAARALPTPVASVGWKRSLGSTYMLTRGNANVSSLGFTGAVARRANRSQIALKAKREFGSQEGKSTENYLSATLRYDLALGPNDSAAATRPSFFTEGVYEHDPFAQIARRAVENTGFSIPLVHGKYDNLALEIGTGVTNEAPTGTSAYTRIGGLLRLAARQAFGAAKSDQQFAIFPDLTGAPGHYRVNSDFNIAAPLAKALALKIGVSNRYDTKPQTNVKKSDTTIQSGIGLEF